MDSELVAAVIGFIAGAVMVFVVLAIASIDAQNRALSCMAAGNTVAQCQDILGIPKK